VCSNPAALLMDRTTGPLEPRCTEADVHAPLLPTMAPAFSNVAPLAVDMTRGIPAARSGLRRPESDTSYASLGTVARRNLVVQK
jgi:hypothetical protein